MLVVSSMVVVCYPCSLFDMFLVILIYANFLGFSPILFLFFIHVLFLCIFLHPLLIINIFSKLRTSKFNNHEVLGLVFTQSILINLYVFNNPQKPHYY